MRLTRFLMVISAWFAGVGSTLTWQSYQWAEPWAQGACATGVFVCCVVSAWRETGRAA